MKKNLNQSSFLKLLIISAVIAIFTLISVPQSFGQNTVENERSAVAALRSIAIANGTYRAQTGTFVTTGLQLVNSGLLNNEIACFIPSQACNQRGYIFTYTPSAAMSNAYFNVVAVPLVNNVTGTRSFYINENGMIYAGPGVSPPSAVDYAPRTITSGKPFLNIFPNKFDLNADGKGDIAVFRPSSGTWFLQRDVLYFGFNRDIQFGLATDQVVPADYDGDGRTDNAVYREGNWYYFASTGPYYIQFGEPTDIPIPGNFDGDTKTDVAVYRPSNGTWYVRQSTGGITATEFGHANDKPVAADFDGDGLADMAVFEPSTGIWQIRQSKDGLISFQFGTEEDKLVVADYDGDGRADIAVYRPSNGFWYVQQSQAGFAAVQFGDSTDLPVPADYDGDGRADIAVYRGGTWFIQQSTAGFKAVQYGTIDDRPVANAFVR